MAEDVLALRLYSYEKDNIDIPEPSEYNSIKLQDNEFINYIKADTKVYRKMYNNNTV